MIVEMKSIGASNYTKWNIFVFLMINIALPVLGEFAKI